MWLSFLIKVTRTVGYPDFIITYIHIHLQKKIIVSCSLRFVNTLDLLNKWEGPSEKNICFVIVAVECRALNIMIKNY